MKKLFVILITLFSSSLFLFGQSPGGVSSQLLGWWKADAGVTGTTNVTGWQDNSPKGNNLTATNGPTLLNEEINYNPSLDFDGTNDVMKVVGGILGTTTHNNIHVTFINKTNDIQSSVLFHEDLVDGKMLEGAVPKTNKNVVFDFGPCCNTSRVEAKWGTQVGVHNLWTFGSSTGTSTPTGTRKAIHRNGEEIATNNNNEAGTGQNSEFSLGGYANSFFHEGSVSEFVIWSSTPTAIELQKIHSYLAIKYSLPLGSDNNNDGTPFQGTNSDGIHEGDYLNTNGDVVWDASVNTAYHNDITGIARDDAQALLQKQSHTKDDVTRVYIDQLMARNAMNSGTYSTDLQYLLIGDNQDDMCSTAATDIEKPVQVVGRIAREWKVSNTNFSETFNLDLELDNCTEFETAGANNFKILVDTDGDFTNATAFGVESGLTFTLNAGRVIVEGISNSIIPADSTVYITLAYASAPLPIELVSFEATVLDNREVLIEWETQVEINNDYFTIERSRDGMSWEGIQRVMGAGNSNTYLSYETVDNDPLPGDSYYRLRQNDFDGTYSYSDIVQVSIETNPSIAVNIFPNPVDTELTIEADPSELNTLRVYDMLGRDVSSMITFTRSNDTKIRADLSMLSFGNYVVVLKSGTHMISKQ